MGLDRFIRFPPGARPSPAELLPVLEDYLGALAENVCLRPGCVDALLIGGRSWPFRRWPEFDGSTVARAEAEMRGEPRGFEVWFGEDSVNVETRLQDPLTSAVAEGFARLVALHWRGEREAD